jgi:Mrp family chromosome partitioning ATPase
MTLLAQRSRAASSVAEAMPDKPGVSGSAAVEALVLREAVRKEGLVLGGAAVLERDTVGASSPVSVRVHRIPLAPGADPRLLFLAEPDSPAAASFRILRHRLGERLVGKVFLVTSPVAGEGKTLCALNLALALSEGGRAKVLLLEANFRNPSLARLLGFQPPVCLGKQLEFYSAMRVHSWDVAETASPWLHTAAIAPDGDAQPLLDGPALAVCIGDMRQVGYDHIVIDGPAVLGSADVNLIEESVDGVLVVLRAGKSRARRLRKAVEQMGGGKLLGFVLLGTRG